MIRRVLPLLAGAAALHSLAATALAAAIGVPNYSFEDDVLTSDGSSPGEPPSQWAPVGETNTDNPHDGAFLGAEGFSTPVGALGPQSGLLFSTASMRSANPLATVTAGATYTLTVAIGDRLNDTEPGTLRIGFLLDDAFVAAGDATFADGTYRPEGTFRDYTFQYTALPGDADKSLKIYLGQTGDTSKIVNFDNVRLSTNVPEP